MRVSPSDPGFVNRIQADLQEFSPVLLEAGLAEAEPMARSAGPLSALLGRVDLFATIVPRVLTELEEWPDQADVEYVPVPVPRRARASHHPRDYARFGDAVRPVQFIRARPVGGADSEVLGWMLHLSYILEDRVDRATGRLAKHLRTQLQNRRDYTWALRKENDILRELESTLDEAEARVRRAQQRILSESQYRLQPTPMPPRPFPMAPAFTSLRLLADELLHPESALTRDLRGILGHEAAASLPFLYQRWCGVKIVQTLRAMGWRTTVDPLPPLFLGGRIRFAKGRINACEITLWCEPHLTLQGRHASGLYSLQKEASPDFVFITPGPQGSDAFVLDPTLSTEVTVRREKSRYLTDLAFDSLQLVAGVPALHQPRRSWSAAPTDAARCELLDLEGRSGTIPMYPVDFSEVALRGWLEDLEAYAMGWQRRPVHLPNPSR